MLRGLPEPALSILTRLRVKLLGERFWQVMRSVVQKLSTCKLAHIVQCAFQAYGIELSIE